MALALPWALASGQEPRNVIRGEVEGLVAGDRIILSVELVDGEAWVATDSVVVNEADKFTLATGVSGSMIRLTRLKAGEVFNPHDVWTPRRFLEGFAELRVTGNVKNWYDIKVSGGLYDHPDMRRLADVRDSASTMQAEAIALLARANKTGDTLSLREAVERLDRGNRLYRGAFFREKNPGMAYSAALLRADGDLMEDMERYEAAFLALAPAARESPAGRLARDYIANARASAVGGVAPDFTRVALDGREVTLSASRGKHVLLDFWGSGCAPCRKAHPLLAGLRDTLLSKGAEIEFISIACGEPNDKGWLEEIREDHLTWIQLNDNHAGTPGSIKKQYAITGVPESLLISPEGEIIYRDHPVGIIPKVKELFGL
jgi:thiol-disulfide isomerase/thioredoxin